jgi:glutaredoxin
MTEVRIEMYSRTGCHLCDEARDVIDRIQTRYAFDFEVVNIAENPELESRYGSEIPVIHINGNKAFKYRVDPVEFEKKLERLWNR